jgi:hypothetical protein
VDKRDKVCDVNNPLTRVLLPDDYNKCSRLLFSFGEVFVKAITAT